MPAIDTLQGTVQQGHGVASGKSANSPYPQGSIAMQAPWFQKLGLDLSDCYLGTLNVAIDAKTWQILKATHQFEHLQWTHLHPPETFSFVRCGITYDNTTVQGWLYYPHPETKAAHWQSGNVMEIIAPLLPGVGYGAQLRLEFAQGALEMSR
jgi:hypothetical protein